MNMIELPLSDYVLRETHDMMTPLNVLGTAQEKGYSPDLTTTKGRNEAALHWIGAGGASSFAQVHRIIAGIDDSTVSI